MPIGEGSTVLGIIPKNNSFFTASLISSSENSSDQENHRWTVKWTIRISKKIVAILAWPTRVIGWIVVFPVVKLVRISLPTHIPRFFHDPYLDEFWKHLVARSKEVSKYVPEVRAGRHKTSSLDLSTRSRHEAAASPDLSSPISVHSCVHTSVRVFKWMFINKCIRTHVYTNP